MSSAIKRGRKAESSDHCESCAVSQKHNRVVAQKIGVEKFSIRKKKTETRRWLSSHIILKTLITLFIVSDGVKDFNNCLKKTIKCV